MTDASTGEGRPFNGRLLALLKDWSHTGIVVVTVLVSGIRWSSTVDSRLTSIEDKIAGQRTIIEQTVAETTKHAGMAAEAAGRAENAVGRAENAVVRAENAVAENKQAQKQVIAATVENRKAIETQTKRVTDLKKEMAQQMEAFAWRVRQLEDQNRKALDKK